MALLNAILKLEGDDRIKSIILLNSINLKEYLKDKTTTLDVKAEDCKGKRYRIEMQVKTDSSYIARVIYYHDRIYTSGLQKSEKYESLSKIISISISILNFNLLDERDLHNIYRFVNINSGNELTDIKGLHFIELKKFGKYKPEYLRTKFGKWLHVLKFGKTYVDDPKNMAEILKTEEEIFMAVNQMKKAAFDLIVRELMEQREKALHDEVQRLSDAEKEAWLKGGLKDKLKD